MEHILQDFSRKRDYYRTPARQFDSFGPVFQIYKAIAETANATLVTKGFLNSLNISRNNFTNIYPTVWIYPGAPYTLPNILYNQEANTSIIPLPGPTLNFAYCDIPQLKSEKIWNIYTLTFSFDTTVWILLFVSSILTTTALFLNFYLNNSYDLKISFANIYFVVFRSIFPDNLELPKKLKKTWLVYVWILFCFLASNYYTAILTSAVISPSREVSHSYASELASNKFRLVFDNGPALYLINASIQYLVKDKGLDSQSDKWNDLQSIYQMLEKIDKKYVLNGPSHGTETYLGGAKVLANVRKTAFVAVWNFAIEQISKVNTLYGNISPHKRPIHCYLGKRLVENGEMYQVMTPPHGKFLGIYGQRLIEAGINNYWRKEYVELRHSTRVQDRNKVISPTKIIYDFEGATAAPMNLEGKISSVFFLWSVCMLVSFCSFFVERYYHWMSKRQEYS